MIHRDLRKSIGLAGYPKAFIGNRILTFSMMVLFIATSVKDHAG